jgi:2-keto-4-pentenoate hydratase/2-oxohepta-3-ene-1,7-dioic acid hydratase in catechol pathway
LANDVTCRELQKSDGQWTRAKGFDTFCPLGPWIETDFIPGTQRIFSKVNDELRQDATLDQMIFNVPDIIVFISQVMTLLPGDVIITGTPAGIGPLIARGSVVVGIEGLGQLTNKVSAKP